MEIRHEADVVPRELPEWLRLEHIMICGVVDDGEMILQDDEGMMSD
jgi:hypothetical protein